MTSFRFSHDEYPHALIRNSEGVLAFSTKLLTVIVALRSL